MLPIDRGSVQHSQALCSIGRLATVDITSIQKIARTLDVLIEELMDVVKE
jgi:hypothetical protein